MGDRARAPQRYDTSIDRAGLALGVGSMLAGGIILGLLLLGGQRDPLALAWGWVIGCVVSACAITAVAGPLWLVMHVAGLRSARYAALVGAVTVMAVFVGAQTYGFGLFAMPAMDNQTWLYRIASAVGSSALLAALAALIGVAMWRVAYRPVGED
ncbi:MAG: hypothetical protein J7500_16180 [Sphingomonas sp.]|uniref:hypothetical protein n=1 Tax=Sphingomonas sp. TaxID=28214 RepID=UPI001B1F3F1A|nr:hypothetical protein [Sphingomonas sp.]MBO9624248.1 hypothetical protein [Sphingomonas sp.]